MALARVQATASVSAASGPLAITFSTLPTVGNAIIVPVLGDTNPSIASRCVDNQGNTYVRAAGQQNSTNTGVTQFFCPKVKVSGGTFTITLTVQTTSVANAIEISGVGDGLAVDAISGAGGTSSAPASGVTPALTAAEVLVVGVHSNQATQASITVASVSPTWTQEFESLSNAFSAGEADSRMLTAAAGTTTNVSWTLATSANWAALLVAYRATTATTGLARVQVSAKLSSATAAAHTLPFSTPPTVGNAVVIAVSVFSGSATTPLPSSVMDNQGHRFLQAAVGISTGNAGVRAGIFYCPKLTVVVGSYAVALTYASGLSGAIVGAGVEVSGVGAGLSVATAVAQGSTSSTAPATGSSLASDVAELFVVAVNSCAGPGSITVEVVSPTWAQEYEELPFSNASGEADSRLRTSQIGVAQSCSWTLGSANNWATALAAFNATVSVAAPASAAETVHLFVGGPV